mmetsp:Transcript_80053/g.235475  ORF Transcript_80053/g.235475 Transcript_80053/m.235475 type:complete len:255 (+) Transcript_80053:366-1130(+)
MVSSVCFGRKSLSSAACSRSSRRRSSSTMTWRWASFSRSIASPSASFWRSASYIWRRRSMRRWASRLCCSIFIRRLFSFICSSRSSSANFARSCSRIFSSSACSDAALSSFIFIWKTYAFFMSSLSSSFFRTWISSRRRASASSSSKCKSLRSCSSSCASLFFASIFPIIAFRTFCFSSSCLSFSSCSLLSCSSLSRAKAWIRSFSSNSALSMASCLDFCSTMNLPKISRVSLCLCIRAACSSASSCAIFSTSS